MTAITLFCLIILSTSTSWVNGHPVDGFRGKHIFHNYAGHFGGMSHRKELVIGPGSPCGSPTKEACCTSIEPLTGQFMIGLLSNGIPISDIAPHAAQDVGVLCKTGPGVLGTCPRRKACCKAFHFNGAAALGCAKI